MEKSARSCPAEVIIGRVLIAGLFLAAAVQKLVNPNAAAELLVGFGLPAVLVWPAMVFNCCAGLCLLFGTFVAPVARVLAAYCILTSVFHFLPADPWQMSIFVKNWAIAGGCFVLAGLSKKQEMSELSN